MTYDNAADEHRIEKAYGATISLTVLATIAVALRLIARRTAAAGLWWDDLVIVLALVSWRPVCTSIEIHD